MPSPGLIASSRALLRSRTLASPESAPDVLVVALYFVVVSMSVRIELIASTKALAWVPAAAVSRATSTSTVLPMAAVETVMSSPGRTSLKVFDAECRVSAPMVIAASRPATTAAPPSRSLPSVAVRVTVDAAPVVVDCTTSR